MSVERYYGACTLVCDYCGARLPLERADGYFRRREDFGWEMRTAKGKIFDICPNCIFEEKGLEHDDQAH